MFNSLGGRTYTNKNIGNIVSGANTALIGVHLLDTINHKDRQGINKTRIL